MNAEILCIAAEHLPEEHSSFLTSYISKKLFELGHRTTFEKVCAPEKAEVEAAIKTALSRSDLVIILGGIEPETNSVAKTALSSLSGIPLVASDEALGYVKAYLSDIGTEPTPEHISASIVLKGADVLKNELGLCPGLALDTESAKILLLPYSEGELTHMFEVYVAALLSPHGISATHTVNVIGLSQEQIESKLSSLGGRSEFALNIEKHGAEYAVSVSSVAKSKEEAEIISSKAVASVKFALGKSAYAVDSDGLQFEAVKALGEKGLTVSTAESCTAGMVSEMLTDVGGSSKVFEYGVSAYSNRIKTEVLKVPEEIIGKYGAVSFEAAKHMAINIRAISGASLGIGITGNAGPSASENKPVGLVYVAIADADSYTVCELNLPSSLERDEIRGYAAQTALDLIRRYALSYPEKLSQMQHYTPIPLSVSTPIAPVSEAVEPAVNNKTDIAAQDTDNFDSTPFAMIFDRETDDEYYDRSTADEYKFTRGIGFNISEALLGFKTKVFAFFKTLLPQKSDGKKKFILKIGFILSLLVFIVSASVLTYQLTTDENQRDIIMDAQQKWQFDGTKNEKDTYTAFEPFYEENEDIRGWITVPGTSIDNPIYQSADNDYYLTHNMYKEKSRYGALFFDYRCTVSSTEPSQNLTIYGHEMKDGSMFGTLKKYKSLSFYKKNPTFNITKLDSDSTYKIFSVMVVNATADDDNGYLFNYTAPSFSSQKQFLSWVAEAKERSIINTTVDVEAHDQVVTLVTCINDFSNARFVVMARLTRENEDTSVNTSDAVLNPNPRYPQAWYDKMGLEGYVDPNSSETATSSSEIENMSSAVDNSDVTDSSVTDSSEDASSTESEPETSYVAPETSVPVATESQPASSEIVSSEAVSSQAISSEVTSTPTSSESVSSEQSNNELVPSESAVSSAESSSTVNN